jgi:hypothetical protein
VLISIFAYLAARNSATAAATLTSIERERWHAELRPKFEAYGSLVGSAVYVGITLIGPPTLHQIDELNVVLRGHFSLPDGKFMEPTELGQPVYRFSRDMVTPVRNVTFGETQLFILEVSPSDTARRPLRPIGIVTG